jgi:Cof subfamily protein (haloacid dehalogenase superfamily)
MNSSHRKRNAVILLLAWLRLLPDAVVFGFPVAVATMKKNTRRGCCLYAFKKGEDDEKDNDGVDQDDCIFDSTNIGRVFDPLGNYPLPSNNGNNNNIKKPNKLDLYSADDLWNVLNIHNQLTQEGSSKIIDDEDINSNSKKQKDVADLSMGSSAGLHEMVLEALQQMEETSKSGDEDDSNDKTSAASSSRDSAVILSDKLRSKLRKIRAIASDVDGTLVAAKFNVHPTTQAAVIEAVQAAYGRGDNDADDDVSSSTSSTATTKTKKDLQLFFLATGKSRAGAMESLGPAIQNVLTQYSVPGVFIQGLYCVDETGRVIFEKRLTAQAVQAATQFALDSKNKLSMFGYNGNEILTTKEADPKHVADYHDVWGEPVPIIIDSFVDYEPGFHKILFMSNDSQQLTQQIRPKLDALAVENNCATTQAVPTMLELLPAGCSKALGVQMLCQHYGIDPSTQLLAIGDAENDIGMLEMAAVGVAVGNASPLVKEVADIVVQESHIQGGAGIAIQQFGLGKALDQ